MAAKIIFLMVVLIAFVLTVQCAPSEGSELSQRRPDVLFIENPDTHPVILSPQEAMANPSQNARACTSSLCSYICAILGFRYGRCDSDGVCVCSNF